MAQILLGKEVTASLNEEFEEKVKTDARIIESAKITKEHKCLLSKEAED